MGLWHRDGSPNLGQNTRSYKSTKNRTCKILDFAVPANHGIKLEKSEKKGKYLDFAWELKKTTTMEHDGDNYTNPDWCFCYSHQRNIKGTGGLGRWSRRGDHPNCSIFGKVQNTEKSPGDLRILAVTQISVKNHQLKLMWKTLNE